MALTGYPVGLTLAPIMPGENWREEYAKLISDIAESFAGLPSPDLTVELITHRLPRAQRKF